MTYSASIILNGATYNYPAGPTLPGFSVFFRTDEVVFHWGRNSDRTIPVSNLGAYTASVSDGTTTTNYSIPFHDWNSRWIHEITPDTIIRTPAELVSQKLIFPLTATGIPFGTPPVAPAVGPMGTSNVGLDMGASGERDDIGLVTEYAAQWINGNDPSGQGMLAWADAAFSIPMHLVDERTGQPWNLVTLPGSSSYAPNGNGGGPYIPIAIGGQWSLDIAHWPELSYVAFCATGKLRHLENLQYASNWGFLQDAIWTGAAGFQVLGLSQTRQQAWGLRNLLVALVATKLAEAQGPLPTYLLPSSYFQTMADNQLAWINKSWVSDPALQTFRAWPSQVAPAFFQEDYKHQVLAWAAMAVGGGWATLFLWGVSNAIARSNGKSGFPPALGIAAYQALGPSFIGAGTQAPGSVTPSQMYPTWAAFFAAMETAQLNGTDPNLGQITPQSAALLAADIYNGHNFIFPQSNDYGVQLHGTLACASYLDTQGIVAVSAEYPDLPKCFADIRAMTANAGQMMARWAYAVTPSVAPTVTPVPGPPVPLVASIPSPPPTQGVPPMSSPASDPLAPLIAIVTQIVADATAEISAIHARISAILAAATNAGTSVNPAELQAQVDALNALHAKLTADTAAIPTATS